VEGGGSVFRNIRECATGVWQDPKPNQDYYAGLDLAMTTDYSVLVIMNEDLEVVVTDRFYKVDWLFQINRIKTAADRYNGCNIYVDSTGKGEPVFESMVQAGCMVSPYTFTLKSKTALIDNLSIFLEQKKIVLPRPVLWPQGIDELEAFEYSVTDAGNVRSCAPYGGHDDCVIALALAAWHHRPRPQPNIRFL